MIKLVYVGDSNRYYKYGKIYHKLSEFNNLHLIVCEVGGLNHESNLDDFVTIEEWRNIQISKLINN